jgi:hypothetical protein
VTELNIKNGTIHFKPGDTIEGTVRWTSEAVKSAALRLFWRTEGKGTQDAGFVDEMIFDQPRPTDQRKFHFTAPYGPLSYDGKLIAIMWALELELNGGSEVAHLDLTIQ